MKIKGEKEAMKNKKIILFWTLFILSIVFINLISAKDLVSTSGVKYEDRILSEFDKLGETEKFVDLIIYLKNISDAEDLVSNFSPNEVGRVINRGISNRITVEMTEEAFFKLIQDSRVESVYYNAPIDLASNNLLDKISLKIILMVLIILIFFLIIIIYLKKIKRKKENMGIKKILFISIMAISLLSFVSSEMLVSDEGVDYDYDLLKALEDRDYANNLLINEDFIGLEIIDDKVWARVSVILKDNSGINVVGNKSEKRELINQRIEWFEEETDKFLSNFSRQCIKDIRKHSGGFGGFITQDCFNSLINDGRIDYIAWSQYKPELTSSNYLGDKFWFYFILFCVLVLLIFLIILFYKLKRKRYGPKK